MAPQEQVLLYNYFRSSASYRVRIALYYKKIPFKYIPVHLVNNGGEQFSTEYKKLNPQAQVPCLVMNGRPICQSMAIIQYLEDICPEPRVFPSDPYEKAIVIQICEAFNSGIQPLQNLTVLAKLESLLPAATSAVTATATTTATVTPITASHDVKKDWIHHWNHLGLASIEELLKKTSGDYCVGDTITAADFFLVPQIFSAKRFGVDTSQYPNIMRINEHALDHTAFQLAEPARQPDAV